jgi:predicted aldo/keto reductase-like oxidoreductase
VAQAPYKGGLLVKKMPTAVNDLFLSTYGKTESQVALDFVIDQKPDIILTGCSSLKTLQETYNNYINYSSLEGNYAPLRQALELYKQENYIPCILCGKCQQVCPQGINIPFLFGGYNKTLADPEKNFELYSLSKYFFPEAINLCMTCGACTEVCPQHLNIPELFEPVFELRP